MHTRTGFYLLGKWQMMLTGIMRRLGRQRFHPAHFDIVPLTVEIPHLATAFAGYRLVQISDIHLGHWVTAERLHGITRLVNAQEPDAIVITGDFVSYVLDGVLEELTVGLRQLQAKDAILAVMGNHDHWLDVSQVRQAVADAGVIELQNDVYTVRRGTAVLHIAGVDDIMVKQDDLAMVLAKLPPHGPAILLAHEPDFADVSAAAGRFALQLSGHSHGGQVVLPGLGPPRGPLFRKYPNGRYQVGDMVQYTNRGLGTNILRLRVNCRPEITVITLSPHHAPAAAAAPPTA